jgi:hypothetical protein
MRGLFVQTERLRDVDAPIRLDFLVQEGPIRAEAVVRHVKPGSGLGLKFTALAEEDGPRLEALMTRLRRLPGPDQRERKAARAFPWSLRIEIARKRRWLNTFAFGAS